MYDPAGNIHQKNILLWLFAKVDTIIGAHGIMKEKLTIFTEITFKCNNKKTQ